jgi:hypothetical protein
MLLVVALDPTVPPWNRHRHLAVRAAAQLLRLPRVPRVRLLGLDLELQSLGMTNMGVSASSGRRPLYPVDHPAPLPTEKFLGFLVPGVVLSPNVVRTSTTYT